MTFMTPESGVVKYSMDPFSWRKCSGLKNSASVLENHKGGSVTGRRKGPRFQSKGFRKC